MTFSIFRFTSPHTMSQICPIWFKWLRKVSLTIRKHLHVRLTCSILTLLLRKALFCLFCALVNSPFLGLLCGIWLRACTLWMPTYPKSPLTLIFGWISNGVSWKIRISDLRPSNSTWQCWTTLFAWFIINCGLMICFFLTRCSIISALLGDAQSAAP